MRSFNTATTPVALFLFYVFSQSFVQAQTVYSVSGGVWNAPNLWNTQSDGLGTPVTNPNDPALSVVVQTGHTVTLPGSADFSVFNLTVENGAVLQAGSSSNRYIQVFGASILVDGTLGGDGLSLDINGPACTLSGSGYIAPSRLRKDLDAGASNTTTLTIDADVWLSWSSSACLLNQASPSNSAKRTFNVIVSAGTTVSAAGDISIDGVNGATNNSWNDGTFTVNGTLDISGNLYINTANPAGGNIHYAIGGSGRIIARSQVVGNAGSGGSALATLTVQPGGTLELQGEGQIFTAFGGGRETVSFNSGALVDYAGAGVQEIEDGFTYARLNISGGGDKSLTGATQVNGILGLFDGLLFTGDHDLNIGIAGSVTGGSFTTYILTSGAGSLRRRVTTTPVLFPVGTFTGYNPAILVNTGTADTYAVRVADGVYQHGVSGNLLTTGVVDKTWLVEETNPGGSNLSLNVQWNGFDELGGFNRFACYLAHYDGGWAQDLEAPASGSGPYTRTRTGIQNLSPFAVGSQGVLPVEFVRFSGKAGRDGVILSWETAAETNNRHFVVERDTSGSGFQALAEVPGAGNSDQPIAYTWLDAQPFNGLAYYRLRQVDLDGQSQFSDVIAVSLSPVGEPGFRLFPTLAAARVTLSFDQVPGEKTPVLICHPMGKILGETQIQPGVQSVELEVEHLRPGWYLLRVEGVGCGKFVKM